MNYKDMIIKDPIEFDKALELINSVVDIHKSFPDQVFRDQFKAFIFNGFDWAITSDFLSTLRQLAEVSGDTHIFMAMVDRDKTGLLYDYATHLWFKVPMTVTENELYELLWNKPNDGPLKGGEFALIVNTVVWVPLSAKWAIWGCRDYEICALSFADERIEVVAAPLIGIDDWMSIKEALRVFVAMLFLHRGYIPEEIKNAFLLNYSSEKNNQLKLE